MNEQLPPPSVVPDKPVRERVLRHMREVLTAGATLALAAGCSPFAVVDPLPPPAKCRELGTVKDALTIDATLSTLQTGSGPQSVISLTLTPVDQSGVTFVPGAHVVTGSISSESITSSQVHLLLQPPSGGDTVVVQVRATCGNFEGTSDVLLTFTLTRSATTVSVSETEQTLPDAGVFFDGGNFTDGGIDGGADAGP
jgi:hypothetical protein